MLTKLRQTSYTHTELFNSHPVQSIPQWFMKSQLFIDHGE